MSTITYLACPRSSGRPTHQAARDAFARQLDNLLDQGRYALRLAGERTALGVFGLVTDFSSPGLRTFVERLARAGRGSALCCPPGRLGRDLLARFLHPRSEQG